MATVNTTPADLGAVTGYAIAKERGYNGTLQDWVNLQLNGAAAYTQMTTDVNNALENKIVVGTTTPSSTDSKVWIDTTNTGTVQIPEIKDNQISDVDTWSSQRISDELGQLSEDIDDLKDDLSEPTRNLNTASVGNYNVNASGVVQPATDKNFGMANKIPCLPSTQYTLSYYDVVFGDSLPPSVYVSYYDSTGAFIERVNEGNTSNYCVTITTPSNAYYVHVYFYRSATNTYGENAGIQIELGSVRTDYVLPYQPKGITETNARLSALESTTDIWQWRKPGRISTSTNQYTSGGKYDHSIVDINPGDDIVVTASSNGNSIIAFLKSYNFIDGGTPAFSDATGFTATITISTNGKYVYTVPDDAYCLYVARNVNGSDRTPSNIRINGYDISSTIPENLVETSEKCIFTPENVRFDFSDANKKAGVINPSTGAWGTSSSARYSIVRVKSGQEITIRANYTTYLRIALLKYYLFSSSNQPAYSDATGWTTVVSLAQGEKKTFTVPADANFLFVERLNGGTDRTPVIFRVDGVDCLASSADNVLVNDLKSTILNLRILEYNLGGYTFGQHEYMTDENCQEYIPKYRAFLQDVGADICALTEFRQNMDEDGDYKSDDELFDFLYPYKKEYEEDPTYSGTAIKSRFPLIYSDAKILSYDATNGLHTTTTYRIARINVNGKVIAIISAHIPVGRTDDYVETRAYYISKMIENVADDEYAIIAGDFNLAGNRVGSTDEEVMAISLEELASTRTYLHSVGWEACNGAYTAPERTAARVYIDNIFYKTGKMIYKDFHSMENMFEVLASDHFPTYADLILI